MIESEVNIKVFKTWLTEIIIGDGKSKDLYIKEKSGGESSPFKYENRYKFIFYTNKYKYAISAVERSDKRGYLGCTMDCRKARAGEDWTRGNDLPDGILNRKTWEKIKNAVIKNELVKIAPKIERIKDN